MENSTPSEKAAKLAWASCDAIAAEHGGSFYLADLGHFERNCVRFLDAFRAIYPNSRIGYSYKTNYLPNFIRRANAIGAYAEVVSRFELDLAEQLGIAGRDIIFNGPVKQPDDLLHAVNIGARINADSPAELQSIVRLAKGSGTPVPIGIRCFLGENTPDSRFGTDLRTPEGAEALKVLSDNPLLHLAGLHCHHSGSRNPQRYRDRTLAMIELHRDVLRNCSLDYIDVGGGFASAMSGSLAAQVSDTIATFEDYAEAVAGEMKRAYGDSGPELIIEPGMSILADTMVFITRVEAIKILRDRQLAVVDGSVLNIKPLRGSINLPITVIPQSKDKGQISGQWDIVGSTCMEIDVLHSGYAGMIANGDFVAIENVGAYSTVLNAPFIHGTPAVLDFSGRSPGRVLRRGSTVADLLSTHETIE